jgi:hypothetical protein
VVRNCYNAYDRPPTGKPRGSNLATPEPRLMLEGFASLDRKIDKLDERMERGFDALADDIAAIERHMVTKDQIVATRTPASPILRKKFRRSAARPNRIDPRCAPLRSVFFFQSPRGCSQFFFLHSLSSSSRQAGQSIKRSPDCTSGSSMMESIAGLSGSAQCPASNPLRAVPYNGAERP